MASWVVAENDQAYTVVESGCAELALAEALARVDARELAERSTRWVEVAVWCEADGQGGRAFVEVPPTAPPCVGTAHTWRAASGCGGVRVEVCRRCGCMCEREAGARGPHGQRYTRVSYTQRDELQ